MRILSVDPGSTNMGFSVIERTEEGTLRVPFCETFRADREIRRHLDIVEFWGELDARIEAAKEHLVKLIRLYEVDAVAYEDSYAVPNRNSIHSYKVAIKLQDRCLAAVMREFPLMEFWLVTPSMAKKLIGAKGNSGDKTAIPRALVAHRLLYGQHLNPETFSEHAWDSIGIGVAFFKHYTERE